MRRTLGLLALCTATPAAADLMSSSWFDVKPVVVELYLSAAGTVRVEPGPPRHPEPGAAGGATFEVGWVPESAKTANAVGVLLFGEASTSRHHLAGGGVWGFIDFLPGFALTIGITLAGG